MKKNAQFVSLIFAILIVSLFLSPAAAQAFWQETSPDQIQIGAMKGPTGMGLVQLMESDQYAFTLTGTSDEIVTGIVGGKLDAAAVPCNLVSVLFNKTEGKIKVAAVNTLGVLYILDSGDSIQTVQDLKGKTLYTTGKGTSPEFVLRHILKENKIDPDKDLTVEFKSESAEIAAMFGAGQEIIALLPQPFVTTVQLQNPDVRIALDMTAEWKSIHPDSQLITGCLIVRNDFAAENQPAFSELLSNYAKSVEFVNEDSEEAAALIEKHGILPKAALALKAIPYCNITLIRNAEMQGLVQDYLSVLFDAEPKSVGGALPDDSFYYKE